MNDKIERLEKHITSLEKSYDNMIDVMNSDIEKDDKGVIKLKDDKIKTYAEGLEKSAKTITFLFDQISSRKEELKKIIDSVEAITGTNNKQTIIEKDTVEKPKKSNLNKHLE